MVIGSIILSAGLLAEDGHKPLALDQENTVTLLPHAANDAFGQQRIREIIIVGNKMVPTSAIRAKIPFRVGSIFKPSRSSDLIRALYAMEYFKPTIRVEVREYSPEEVDVYLFVEEKDLVDEFVFRGNNNLSKDEIDKEVNLSNIRAIDEGDVQRIVERIKYIYQSKDYHNVSINASLVPTQPGRLRVVFNIKEGPRSFIRRVRFVGNHTIPSKKLRRLIFTREEWPFGFLNKAGSFHPEALEQDRFILERYYQSNGFIHARVRDVTVETDPEYPAKYLVTFYINEGEIYTINSVSAVPNELLNEEEIRARINLYPGQLYSAEKIHQVIQTLRLVWGEYGYIFADTNVDVRPNDDDRTVDLTFSTQLGSPVICNRISISGNERTCDYVIMRQISLVEGDLLTTRAMDMSREAVGRLGFFDQRDGVNWRVTRINDTEADLDLMLKEVKTGKLGLGFKVGGDRFDITNPTESFEVTFDAQNINFRGTGIRYHLSASSSSQERQAALSVTDPWFLGKPIIAGFSVYHRSSTYTEFRSVRQPPKEQKTGGLINFGYDWEDLWGGTTVLWDVGVENISYKNDIIARVPPQDIGFQDEFQGMLDRIFVPGLLVWTGTQFAQDLRNHPLNPTRGYVWSAGLKVGIPVRSAERQGFGFVKFDADYSWYTPLINEYDLIFHFHAHAGIVEQINDFTIPYYELYHLGGPASVRGYLWGQIGPSLFGDSLGGKKAFWMNAELIFPITRDFNTIGLVFFDGGASWDTPDADNIPPGLLRGNQFKFRQAVGFGIKMRQPTPISIEVGLKLDRNRRTGEPVSEVHFTSMVNF